MESISQDLEADNTNANADIESQSGMQSCSGNILTKLQCIKIPATDNNSSIESLDSIDSQSGVKIERTPNTQTNIQNNHLDHDVQTCSGNILTTLQCIKMPVEEGDTHSIESIGSSSGDRSHSSRNTKNNQTSADGNPSDISSPSPSDSSNDKSILKRKHSNLSGSRASSVWDSESDLGNDHVSSGKNGKEKIGSDDVETPNTDTSMTENTHQDSFVLMCGNLTDTDDDDDGDLDDHDFSLEEQPNVPQLYPMGQLVYSECDVCFEKKDINIRVCCDKPVCDDCMLSFITIQVQQAIVKIQCPSSACDQTVHRDEIMTRLSGDLKDKFYKFLVDANKEPHIKTCPRCSTVMTIDPNILKDPKVKKKGLCVKCSECSLEWCFTCQAPWHNDIKCKQFRQGDTLFKRWTKEQTFGYPNARKCPKCKIFIQRSTGCDHMRCTKCNSDFCYQCGERFRSVKFIGDHYSRLSILGCKYRLYPDRPVPRKLIRGSICGAKLLVTPLVVPLLLAAGAVILAGGIFILPVWAGLRIRRHLREKEMRKWVRADREHWEQRRAEIRKTGDPYLEQFNRIHSLGMNPYTVSGSIRKGRGHVLMVDELDMRLPHIQLDDLSLASMDNNQSSTDSFGDSSAAADITLPPGEQRIKLSPNSLDIHASLDAAEHHHHHHHHHHKLPPQAEVVKLEPLHEVKVESSRTLIADMNPKVTTPEVMDVDETEVPIGPEMRNRGDVRPKEKPDKTQKGRRRHLRKKSDKRTSDTDSEIEHSPANGTLKSSQIVGVSENKDGERTKDVPQCKACII